jgi:SAM-dependent methyltransferase
MSVRQQNLDNWLQERLVCPREHSVLRFERKEAVCEQGHRYPVVEGIPVLLVDDVAQTHGEARKALEVAWSDNAAERVGITETSEEAINPHVQQLVASTCGFLYRPLIGKLRRYPIPELRLPAGEGRTLLDIGCSWGRWTVAAARKGYHGVGLDPSLGAALVAAQVSRQLGLECQFVVGDARYLPFRPASLDTVFSYSVIQHFSKEDAHRALEEIGRVMTASGRALVQMPNAYGIRSLYHSARRGRRAPRDFDVRYWTPDELRNAFREKIGPAQVTVDGFFGLGIQSSDLDLLPWHYRAIAQISGWLRSLSKCVPFLGQFADSLFLEVQREQAPSSHE